MVGNLFYILLGLVGILAVLLAGFLSYRMKRMKMELYFVKNPDKKFIYFEEKGDALRLYKALVQGDKKSVFKKVSLSVLPIFGKEIQIEDTIRKRDLKSDRYLMGDAKVLKKKDDVDGG